jgi:uncharacterized phiE125 gp8 family phage protein
MYRRKPTPRWSQSGNPSFEPLTLADAKAHLRVDVSDEDTLITSLISAARIYVEARTGRVLSQRAFTVELDGFPMNGEDIVLPFAPVSSIVSVSYFDTSGAAQPMVAGTNYRSALGLHLPRLRLPVTATEWPETANVSDAVSISLIAGYSGVNAVPETINQAMRLLVGHWFENREAVVTGTISSSVQMTVESLCGIMRTGEVML